MIPEPENSNRVFEATDEFLRRVHPEQLNPEDGTVSTAAFTPERMSVNWSDLSSVEDTLIGHEGWGVVSFTAALCWGRNQAIEHTPAVDNEAHCDVVGKKTTAVRKAFKKGSTWLHRPTATK